MFGYVDFTLKSSSSSKIIATTTTAMIILVTLSLSQITNAHYHRAYFRNSRDFDTNGEGQYVFSLLPDDYPLNQIFALATHNTAAYDTHLPFVTCQTVNPYEQLTLGVRMLDVRLRRSGNGLVCHHDLVYLHMNFDDLLSFVFRFLREFPAESVMLALQEEYKPDGDQPPLCETLDRYIDSYNRSNFVYFTFDNSLKLKDVRGKVILMGQKNFDQCPGMPSITRCDSQMYWEIESTSGAGMYKKWRVTKDHSWQAIKSNGDNKSCFVTFTGGNNPSALVYPDFVVSGHLPPYRTSTSRAPTGDWCRETETGRFPDFPKTVCVFGMCIVSFEGINVLYWEHFLAQATTMLSISMLKAPFIVVTDFFGDAFTSAAIKQSILKKMFFEDAEFRQLADKYTRLMDERAKPYEELDFDTYTSYYSQPNTYFDSANLSSVYSAEMRKLVENGWATARLHVNETRTYDAWAREYDKARRTTDARQRPPTRSLPDELQALVAYQEKTLKREVAQLVDFLEKNSDYSASSRIQSLP